MLAANAPIAKTLRPCREESVDFDTTQNLFIEGDNLEALKLLQETYLGKVKMIYIDPPYNTGHDFLYRDDFSEDTEKYFDKSMQTSSELERLVANPESNGRFHSDWLSMMCSRIRLSRNLLRRDGILLVSVDDDEIANMRKVCDEVFGEDKFIGTFKWNNTSKAPTLSKKIRGKFEYVICYERFDAICLRGPDSYNEMAPLFNSGNNRSKIYFPEGMVGFRFDDGTYKSGEYGTEEKMVIVHDDIIVKNGRNLKPFSMTARFKWSQSTVEDRVRDGCELLFKTPTFITMYYTLIGEDNFIAPSDLLSKDECGVLRNDEGHAELKALFDGKVVFDYPKPISLPKYLVRMANDPTGVYLDFFAGSATSPQAVMELNAEDGGSRRWIAVQLPEICGAETQASVIGFDNIADLAKERLRRAVKKIAHENELIKNNIALGFRVLKIDSSNMKDVYYSPADTSQAMLGGLVDNIKPDRTGEDLLFQVLLDCGVDLGLPIRTEKIDDCDVFFVNDSQHASPDLVACFDPDVPESLVKTIAAKSPLRAVFRDQCFSTDADKINVEQIFKQMSPQTQLRSL